MAYHLPQGNKDLDCDLFQGFGASSLNGFIPHSYNVNDGIASLDNDPFPSMEDHHGLSLQPDDDSLQTPFFTLNSKFNPLPSSLMDEAMDHDNASSQMSFHSITSPLSLEHDPENDMNMMMQFPGQNLSSVSPSNNTSNNPSPGSTASTSSNSSLHHLQPKVEPNFGFHSLSNIQPLTTTQPNDVNQQNMYNKPTQCPANNTPSHQYLNTSLNMNATASNQIKHEPQMYDKVINQFMTDYRNDKNKQNKTPNNQWMLNSVPFVPPSYTNSATARINTSSNGLSKTIAMKNSPVPSLPHIPPIPNANGLTVPPNYAISNTTYVPPAAYYHPIVSSASVSSTKNTKQYSKALSTANAKKHQCHQCSKKFKHQSNLKIHLIVHTDKALVCSYCNKKFARKTNLKQHERVHTGERPFECNICKRKFKQKHSLKDHIKIHTGEKPFVCEFCNKSFKIKHNLTLHLRTHTGEKPHQCSVCLLTFQSQKDLRNHKFQCGSSNAAAANVMLQTG
eukprot:218496_1